MSHGLLFNVNYTWSHSIDNGSTWHSGSTTSNGAAAGEGFTTDPTMPQFDRGNSIYDIRHRLVINHVWQLPGQNLKGVIGIRRRRLVPERGLVLPERRSLAAVQRHRAQLQEILAWTGVTVDVYR